ncbi:ComEA family DNA-binding protein [Halomonas sp. McH1-25]|uniref:ComEA family DNA-binding protein n=1 Tax=unclassified Halomonas TaxID=2609666 RepID=UPI001EF6C6AB|nr:MULTISPECIES: ComEA family DNA-binding protein [unclassified Halomonas]MCG7598914.1 ComEA family DNA-binding protein [Halomonas sp. McH1-25]MCP1363411.1 ComEA family DNA-binding protein [Halomonas sp. BBD45]
MKSLLKAIVFSLLLGSASLAMAQDATSTVNINTADAETLAQLPGIGAAKAQAIVEDRTANGPFASVDELDRVSGVGAATVDGLRAQAGT